MGLTNFPNGISSFGVPVIGAGQTIFGKFWFVNTTTGSDGNNGKSTDKAFATMAKAFTAAGDNDVIFVRGTVAEQITAPLGVQGVKIVGAVGGRTRHDDGARWKEAGTAGNAPLLTLREQGWEVHNLLMVPQTGYSAAKLHRAESATYPDASHVIFNGVKFIGNVAITTAGGIGIEDFGGMHNVLVENCGFYNLVSGIVATDVSIAAPLRNTVRRSVFELNTHDIRLNGSHCVIEGNHFMTKYDVSTHPSTVNLAYTADVSGFNRVVDNYFADATANVTIAKGYKPSTGDVWRNFVTDAAAQIVTVPA